MDSTWIFIIGIILIVLVVMKVISKKQEWVVKIVIMTFIFFMLTAGYVYVDSNSSVGNFPGVVNFGKAYFSWLSGAFANVKDISGYISKHEWNSDNKTLKK